MATKTVVFIHGLFLTYKGWEPWVKRYQAKGYNAIAIPWPLRDKSVEELRRIHPDPALGQLTLDAVLQHHINVIQGLSEKPIIIGHSFGGLLTQLLINRGLGAAGVAVDSAPPQGVLSFKWSFLKAGWPLLNFARSASKPYFMSFPEFQYAFVNGQPLEEQRRAYDTYVVPESLRAGRGALTSAARVDYNKPHAPLLFIAGETDHIIPASLNETNFKKYPANGSVTAFKQFSGRNHFGLGAPGWEEMADYALDWAVQQNA